MEQNSWLLTVVLGGNHDSALQTLPVCVSSLVREMRIILNATSVRVQHCHALKLLCFVFCRRRVNGANANVQKKIYIFDICESPTPRKITALFNIWSKYYYLNEIIH